MADTTSTGATGTAGVSDAWRSLVEGLEPQASDFALPIARLQSRSDHSSLRASRADSANYSPPPYFPGTLSSPSDEYTYEGPNEEELQSRLDEYLQQKLAQGAIPALPSYTYEELGLDCIRLLRLDPGIQNDLISCCLTVVPLLVIRSGRYQYQALSYVWGSENKTHTIVVRNGIGNVQGASHHKVRRNLFAALKQLRSRDKAIYLWIDSLCINQQNLTERAEQVLLMPDIYNNAWSVTVWLGDSTTSPHSVTEGFDVINSILDLTVFDRATNDSRLSANVQSLVPFVNFASIFKLPWFSRRWVVQELVLARRAAVRFGSKIMNWNDLADATALFLSRLDKIRDAYEKSSLARTSPDAFTHVEPSGAVALAGPSGDLLRKLWDGKVFDRVLSLEQLVVKFQYFETSDPRDTIYSLLSLAKEGNRRMTVSNQLSNSIKVEYDLHPLDVFLQFVEYCIKRSRSLDIICRSWAPKLRDCVMPSWVGVTADSAFGPPFKSQGRINGDSLVGVPEEPRYSASDHRIAKAHLEKTSEQPMASSSHVASARMHSKDKMRGSSHPEQRFDHQTSPGRKSQPDTATPVTTQVHVQGSFSTTRQEEAELDTQPALASRSQNFAEPKELSVAIKMITNYRVKRSDRVSETGSQQTTKALASSRDVMKLYTGVLHAKGIIVDTITEASARVVDGTIPHEALRILGWQKGDDPTQTDDQLWRTLCADRMPDGKSAPMWYHRACALALRKTSREGDLNTSRVIATASHNSALAEYLHRVQSVVWSRRFFVCEGGLVGFGSREINKDDMICILHGCSVPVVLRPMSGHSVRMVKLKGECFAHGMMNGEAFAGHGPEYPAIDFEIH